MPKQIDELRIGIEKYTSDAVAVEDGERVIQTGGFEIVEEHAVVFEDIRSAIEEDRNFARVPDEIASPFVAVEDSLVCAVTIQIRQRRHGEILRLRCMQAGRRRDVVD